MKQKTLFLIAAVLFWATAAFAIFGPSKDLGMGVLWLAIGVTFFALAFSKGEKE